MRILYINSVIDYGSTGKLVRECAEDQKRLGNEVLICYGRNRVKDERDCFYFGDNVSTLLHVGMTRLFGRHGLHSIKQTKKLLKRIDEYRPDIVHLHNIHGYYLNYPLLFDYLRDNDVKVIWTLHDCWAFSGSSAYFDYDGCKQWDEGCVICNSTKTYPEVFGIKRQAKNFALKKRLFTSIDINKMTIVTPSKWLGSLAKSTFLKKYDISTIYNGIPLERFSMKTTMKDETVINCLGVANIWEQRKGLEDFIQLSKILPDTYKLTLVGLNQKQIDSLPSNIHGILRTDSFEELVELYQQSHLYLNLSYEETMGMTTVEALACGTPCIVYNKTAVPEMIDTSCGVVVKAGDIKALAKVIQTFNFALFKKENCVKRAQLFRESNMLKGYEKKIGELYDKN